jgi:subtilisin family serine protease
MMTEIQARAIACKAAKQVRRNPAGDQAAAIFIARNRLIAADLAWGEHEETVIEEIRRVFAGEPDFESDPPVTIPPDYREDFELFAQAPNLWHLQPADWEPIWAKGTGTGIKIAILDTGYSKHVDGPEPIAERSFTGQPVRDRHGHGTHCAGTALGRNGIGVAPGAELIVGKVLSDSGSGSSSGIAAGLRWAVDQGADVISMSLGGGSSYTPTNEAIDYAWTNGAIVNAAAGNSGYRGGNTIGWPAKYRSCVCTAAYDSSKRIANFSSGGSQIDWACPGVGIISFSNSGSGYRSMSGTSMATPYGSGLLALLIERARREGRPDWTSIEALRAVFKGNMQDAGAPGFDVRFGMGIPIAEELLTALAADHLTFA